MDFDFSPEERAFRAEAAAYIKANIKEGVINDGHAGANYTDTPARREFIRALAKKGLLGLSWPKEYGGKGMPFIYDYHLLEELCLAGAPQTGKGIGIIGQTLIRHGTEFQKQLLLPKILSGEIEWAIGYSEPEAGSDLAALKLKATRDPNGHGWRLNGQKRFNTSAHYGDWYWLAARTDPNAPKHKGITLFMFDIAEARGQRHDGQCHALHRRRPHQRGVLRQCLCGRQIRPWRVEQGLLLHL
jgi:alkylation response protein AidB-like acyl-CoA dehydrogenase